MLKTTSLRGRAMFVVQRNPPCLSTVLVLDARGTRTDAPTIEMGDHLTWQLDVQRLESWLRRPTSSQLLRHEILVLIGLADARRGLERFRVLNSPIMAPELAAVIPRFKSSLDKGWIRPRRVCALT